ncbi:MAG: RagB/SusD family nutrient uptake outer membrane protein [Ferruginibacter sp.]|nr:RagB/SusD family nutrient uptake outer membrane protein [Ferruginibacter sp.]
MKKIILIFVLFIIAIAGCKKGLEPVPYGSLTPANFPKSEGDFNLLTTGVYKLFTSKWGYSDGGVSGNLFFGVEYSNVFLNDYPTDLIAYFPEWGGFFDGFSKADFNFLKTLASNRNHLEKIRFITKVTQIINDIEKSEISDASKKQYTAEAKAARGSLMYYLLTMYGPVPVITDAGKIGTDEEKNMKRPARDAYVSVAAADLRFAADNLVKSPADYGRFNKGYALTMLARLYLNEKNWQKAEQAAREVVALGYSLAPSYASLFKAATEKNNETIWAVTCDPTANGNDDKTNMNAWSYYCFPANFPGNITSAGGRKLGGWASPAGAFTATWKFYDSFDPSDTRRALLVDQYAAVNSSGNPTGVNVTRASGMRGPVIAKYPDDDPTAFAGNDIPICRYSDVLLTLAEAINEQNGPTGEAQGYINQVRTRAGISNLTGADISSKDALRDAILRERGWELFFEGHRRIDLIRMNKWTSTLASVGKTASPGPALFPVPQYMLDLGMEQTPGY